MPGLAQPFEIDEKNNATCVITPTGRASRVHPRASESRGVAETMLSEIALGSLSCSSGPNEVNTP